MAKTRILIPVLALLLCLAVAAATVFAVLFFDHSDSEKAAEYKEKWNSATDHKLYFDDGLWKNANIFMKDLTFTEHSISFTVINNTHRREYFHEEDVSVQRLENGQWVDANIGFGYTGNAWVPQPFMQWRMNLHCAIRTDELDSSGQPIYDETIPIPHGYYRVVLAMEDYNVVGYLQF